MKCADMFFFSRSQIDWVRVSEWVRGSECYCVAVWNVNVPATISVGPPSAKRTFWYRADGGPLLGVLGPVDLTWGHIIFHVTTNMTTWRYPVKNSATSRDKTIILLAYTNTTA